MSGMVQAAPLARTQALRPFSHDVSGTGAHSEPPGRTDNPRLDFRVDDVQAFIGALQSDPFQIRRIAQDVALTVLDGSWTETASERLSAVARWCLRHCLTSKTSNEILAVVGSSLTFCSQAIRSADLLASTRLAALAEVLDEHLRARSLAAPERVLQMAHVPEILDACARLSAPPNNGPMFARKRLIAETGLGQANLTRIMGWLVEAGLVEQSLKGREVEYRLSAADWASASCRQIRDQAGGRGRR